MARVSLGVSGLPEALRKGDLDGDRQLSLQEIEKLPEPLRTKALALVKAPVEVVPAEAAAPLGPISVWPQTPGFTGDAERVSALLHGTDAMLCSHDADLTRALLAPQTAWSLQTMRALARRLELPPNPITTPALLAEARARLASLPAIMLGQLAPDTLAVLKRLAKAAGVPETSVMVQGNGIERVPLLGVEKLAVRARGLSVLSLLRDPATASLGRSLLAVDRNADGFVDATEFKKLAPALREEVRKVVDARRAPEQVTAEAAGPISTRVPQPDETLTEGLTTWRLVDALGVATDAQLLDWQALRAIAGQLETGEASNPNVLRAAARVCELAKGQKDLTVLNGITSVRRALARVLVDGSLTPKGLANAPARESLAIVLRAAAITGVDPKDVRVTAQPGKQATLAQVQDVLGDLDLVPVVRGSGRPEFLIRPAPAPEPTWRPDFSSPDTTPIGDTPSYVLTDSFWKSIWPQIDYDLSDGSIDGGSGPASADDAFLPPVPEAPAATPVNEPPDTIAVSRGGYVNPWAVLGDPSVGAYLSAVQGGYTGGWLAFVNRGR